MKGRDPGRGDLVTAPHELSDVELEWIYRSDAIAARAVDVLPDDATRQWFDISIDGDNEDAAKQNEDAETAQRYLRRLKARPKIRRGLSMGRLFGGAICVLGVDDGAGGFDKPVNEKAIRSVRWLQIVDAGKVAKGPLVEDTQDPFFGEPGEYEVHLGNSVERIHASRVIEFPGGYKPVLERTAQHWDDSVLTRLWDPLRNFQFSYAGVARLVRTFNIAKWQMKGLNAAIAANKESQIRKRLEIAELSMSILNAMLMDADSEDIDIMQRPVNGLADLLDRFGVILSAATGMPMTLLLGLSPGGFGTGEDEDRRWNNVVQAYQGDVLEPGMERLVKYVFLADDGPTKGALPEKWSIQFRALKTPSEKEQAEIQEIISRARVPLVTHGVLLPDEVAEGMWGRGHFSMDLALDRDEREAVKREEERVAREQAKLAKAAAKAGQQPGAQPATGGEGDNSAAPEGAQTPPGAGRADALPMMGTVLDILESAHAGRLGAETAQRLLERVCGYPADEAESLIASAA